MIDDKNQKIRDESPEETDIFDIDYESRLVAKKESALGRYFVSILNEMKPMNKKGSLNF